MLSEYAKFIVNRNPILIKHPTEKHGYVVYTAGDIVRVAWDDGTHRGGQTLAEWKTLDEAMEYIAKDIQDNAAENEPSH